VLGLTDQLHLELSDTDERPITLMELLLHRGRAHLFSLDPRDEPRGPTALLRQLASLAPGVLDGLHFEVVLPSEEEKTRGAAGGRLIARGGGKRYEAPGWTEDIFHLDILDMAAALDFLNALARGRGSEVRWMVFDTDESACVVVAGPAPVLESLQAQGLIPSSYPDRLRALGAVKSRDT
jgi:hypothetical protein